jgi:hypothetical protein
MQIGRITPMDMQLIEDQLQRFTNSPGHMLHAKIVGDTRDGVVSLVSKKFLLILFIMLVI